MKAARVLVVDDDAHNRELLLHALGDQGHRVSAAADADEQAARRLDPGRYGSPR
jgi:CheY-like chemotaxis protein